MRTSIWILATLLLASCTARGGGGGDDDDSADDDDATSDDDDATADDDDATGATQVRFETTLGTFTVEVFEEESPITVANFLSYVDSGFYDGSDGAGACIVHRVVAGFVIQGGGLTEELQAKATQAPIVNEASSSGLSNLRGTLSMARTNAPDSATSQWFVNLVDNEALDPGGATPDGYAVFAEVVEGMDVVDAIGAVAVSDQAGYGDVPVVPVVLELVERP